MDWFGIKIWYFKGMKFEDVFDEDRNHESWWKIGCASSGLAKYVV